jgi:uncharacterized membrane protein
MSIFILIHSISSIVALVFGTVNLFRIKGTKIHKVLGWMFIICMFISATSSFGIYNNKFSLIYTLSLLVIILLSRAIYVLRLKPKNYLHIHAYLYGHGRIVKDLLKV